MAKRQQRSAVTGLAAKLDKAARTGKMPEVETIGRGSDEGEAVLRRARKQQPIPTSARPVTIPVPGDEDEAREGDSWEAELPEADPADVAAALSESLSTRDVTEADIDRLWDWIRADEDKGKAFLGKVPETSSHLRYALAAFNPYLFALDDSGAEGDTAPHIGFAAVQLFEPDRAALHLYLAKAARGDAKRIIPQLMEMAAGTFPGRVFVIITEDQAAARLYRSFGFTASFILTWKPRDPDAGTPAEDTKPEPDEQPEGRNLLEDENG